MSRNNVLIAVGLLLLGGSLRYHKIGEWSFSGDEMATLAEYSSFSGPASQASDSQIHRLPRLIPLSYVIIGAGCRLFGQDEGGSRIILAALGSLIVPLAFAALVPLRGRPTALATALLLALWPTHIFFSQNTRYYIIVGLFAYLSLLAGAYIAEKRSIAAACLACGLAFAAVLCHTVTMVLWAILVAAVAAACLAERRRPPLGVVLVFIAAGVAQFACFVFYAWPLMRGWNQGETWGYTPLHSILGLVNSIGWGGSLTAALGLLLALRERTAQNWYWATCALGCGALVCLLPFVMPFAPAYGFPFAFSVIALAGFAVAVVYERLKVHGRFVAAAWVLLACLADLPSLVSHYVDGSRHDMRAAAEHVQKNWRPGDRLAAFSTGYFKYYAPDCQPTIPLSLEPLEELKALAGADEGTGEDAGRLWVVLQNSRGGLPEDLRSWLATRGKHVFKVQRKRFDYAEYTVDAFLLDGDRR